MAIDLPPGTAPALATAQEIQTYRNSADEASAPSIRTKLAGYEIIVLGNRQLDENTVRNALEKGHELSEAVWHLHYAYLQAGHRLTRLRYHLAGTQLFIRVIEGRISEIRGPDTLTRYFWEIEGRKFELPKLEPRRVLANLQAKRSGLLTQSSYEPLEPTSENLRLSIETREDPDYSPRRYSLTLGNPGNRFVGRHFALAGATLDTSAAQWKLTLNKSINALDDDETRNGRLVNYQLSANSIMPIGLFAAAIGRTDYSFQSLGNRFDADVRQGQLQLQEIAWSDLNKRSLLSQRLIYVDSQIQEQQSRQAVLEERYFAAEVGIDHTVRHTINGLKPILKYSADLRKGLSDNSGTLGETVNGFRRDAGFLLLRPAFEASLMLRETWQLKFQAQSQFADREVPEQQQWLLGGPERMRAWLPGTLIGDSGHYLNIEIHTPDYRWSRVKLKPLLFIEAGASRFKADNGELSDWQRAYDIGIGLGVEFEPRWQLKLSIAEPIADTELSQVVSRENETSLFFSLEVTW